ncbi:MAG: cytochrome c family protein, partial [Candidatus Magnetoglobus multicellularis str. Araruama]
PGQWLETGNFWHGFFNPGFLPSLLFRTALTIVFAGIFGLLTATVGIEKESLRNDQVNYCAKWILLGLLTLPVFSHFYFYALPEQSMTMIQGASPEIQPIVILFLIISVMLAVCGGIMLLQLSRQTRKVLAYALLILGLVYMGSFEWIREASRKPFIIYNYMYANQMYKNDAEKLQKQGILKHAKWTRHKAITSENVLAAGHDLYLFACSSCHSIGGPMNDILTLTKKYDVHGIEALLTGQGKILSYMPRFYGTDQERSALAKYIVYELNQNTTAPAQPSMLTIPAVSSEKNVFDQYTLLAWANKGMHLHADCNGQFELGKSMGTIQAQLIHRDELPEHVMDGVDMTYSCESQNITGKMTYDDIAMTFVAKNVHVSAFDKDGRYNPYPVITIIAQDRQTNKCIARTQMIFAVSSAMACKNCHGGTWKHKGQTGVAMSTANDILHAHDRISKTSLIEDDAPKACNDCHELSTNTQILNLSSAIHGFHANYIDDDSENACMNCHASYNGKSLCYRGLHVDVGLTCVDCHGSLTDHALALLVHEQRKGKKTAKRYMKYLVPDKISNMEDIQSRKPWSQEPDCLTCHVDYETPEIVSGYNQWTETSDTLFRNLTGNAGIRCTACHGQPHSLYPASNIFDSNRDNIQALQYQSVARPIGGNGQCSVCHMINMQDNYHHKNMVQ